MQIQCPHCRGICETEIELHNGQHVICPFCNTKFTYLARRSSPEIVQAQKVKNSGTDVVVGFLLGLILGLIGILFAALFDKDRYLRGSVCGFVVHLLLWVPIGCLGTAALFSITNSTGRTRPTIQVDIAHAQDEEAELEEQAITSGRAIVDSTVKGLMDYQQADRKRLMVQESADVKSCCDTARRAISDTIANAQRFADEFDAFAGRAEVEREKIEKVLEKIMPVEKVSIEMADINKRAKECMEASQGIRDVVKKIKDKGISGVKNFGNDRNSMEGLAALSRELAGMCDEIKTSREVDTVRKGLTFIHICGEKKIELALKRKKLEELKKRIR